MVERAEARATEEPDILTEFKKKLLAHLGTSCRILERPESLTESRSFRSLMQSFCQSFESCLMTRRARGQPSSRREDGHEGVMEPWWPACLEGLRAPTTGLR